jgi:hypothetical protein
VYHDHAAERRGVSGTDNHQVIRRIVILLILLAAARPAIAQDPPHQHPSSESWQWGVEANVFAGYNYQFRKIHGLR